MRVEFKNSKTALGNQIKNEKIIKIILNNIIDSDYTNIEKTVWVQREILKN